MEKLLYIEEHTSCHHYNVDTNQGFILIDEGPRVSARVKAGSKHYVCMVLEGDATIRRADKQTVTLHANEMIFLPKEEYAIVSTELGCKAILAYFEGVTFICDKISFFELKEFKRDIHYQFEPKGMLAPLQLFSRQLYGYLSDGARCAMLYDIKLKEFFWLFRAYYTKRQLVQFFYPIVGINDFRERVFREFSYATTVKELAERVCMSESNFAKAFVEEFEELPSDWIRKRTSDRILFELRDPLATMSEVAERLNFSSPQAFSRFCSKNLGEPPTVLQQQLRKEGFAMAEIAHFQRATHGRNKGAKNKKATHSF